MLRSPIDRSGTLPPVGRPEVKGSPGIVIADAMIFLAAVLAGTGGALFGARFADALNVHLGRTAPIDDDPA